MRNRDYRSLWIALFCVNLVNSAQAAIAVVGIPIHSLNQSFSDHQLASLLGIFPVAAGVAALFSGTVSDLMGRRPTLIAGLLVLSSALLLHAVSKDFQTLLVLRAISGLATGALTGLPSTLLSDSLPESRQVQANSRALTGYALGQTLGIPLGIALLEVFSFPQLCSGLGVIALLLTLALRFQLPGHNPSKYFRKDEFKAYCHAALETTRVKRFALLTVSSFFSFAALSLFYSSFALWLIESLALRPSEIAPMHLAGGTLQILVFVFGIRYIQRLRPNLAASFSLMGNSLIFWLAVVAFEWLENAPAALLALTIACVAIRIPSVQYMTNNLGARRQKGLRMSIVQTSNHLGKACGFVAASYLYGQLELPRILLISGAATLLCGVILLYPFRPANARDTNKREMTKKLNVTHSRI